MKKICTICGKEYEPHYSKINSQKTCSKECRKALTKQYADEYKERAVVKERHKAYMREYNMAHRKTICMLCGKPIIRDYSTGHTARTRMHDECIYADIAKTLNEGKSLSIAQAQRLYQRGYDLQSFREEWLS